MDWFRHGYIEVSVTSADIEGCLASVGNRNITVYNIIWLDDLTIHMQIERKNMRIVAEIMREYGTEFSVLRHYGVVYTINRVIKRPILLTVSLLLVFLSLYLPSRILFIGVVGNSNVSDEKILSAAESCGVRFGISRRSVKSEKIKNQLLATVPELQWAAINTQGCVAVITVKERTEPAPTEDSSCVYGISASRDGVIRHMVVTGGNKLCSVGEAVKKGQLLISSYKDCGIMLKNETAKGEIYADTTRTIESCTPTEYRSRTYVKDTRHKIGFLFGKNMINLYNCSRISDTTCVKIYKEYKLKICDGFTLPFSVVLQTEMSYDTIEEVCSDEEKYLWVCDAAEKYLLSQMHAGQICSRDGESELSESVYLYKCNYACYEMIGESATR